MLIAIVPTLALISILVFVTDDSRVREADARLTAGIDTARGLYDSMPRQSQSAAKRYLAEVRRLTANEGVLFINGVPVATTVTPIPDRFTSETPRDVTIAGREYRGLQIALDADRSAQLILLGHPKSGGVLGVGRGALAVMVWFLVAAAILAWGLARTLTRRHERITQEAMTDPLTGLWNRRYLAQILDREIEQARVASQTVSILLIDIDHFKQINDAYGHQLGDEVLLLVARAIGDCICSVDIGARFGGDELLVVLPRTGSTAALGVAAKLRARVNSTEIAVPDKGTMHAKISIGVATAPDHAENLGDLIAAADGALLEAKRSGKNRTELASFPRQHTGKMSREDDISGRSRG